MKLAIIGSSPIALEAALCFHSHGASLTWYRGGEEDFYELFPSAAFKPSDFISELGLGYLKQLGRDFKPKSFNWDEWWREYAAPLAQYLASEQKVRSEEVISVTKRFLAPEENIAGKSRFYDLFRVIFLVDPQKFIQEQKESDPEKYQKLSQELVGSLQSTIEMFEDFDLVIDARFANRPSSIALSGRALGEKRLSGDKLIQGLAVLRETKKNLQQHDVREIALIGSETLAAEVLLQMDEWLKDPRNRLFLITHEEEPFTHFLTNARGEVMHKVRALLHTVEERLEKDFDSFHQALREWQQLDDFVRAKKPRPAEPIPQVNFFSGHNVTAIDELIDRQRLFLTLEKPEFREGKKHPENNRVELKTIGVDRVINGHELTKNPITSGLSQHEPGYFELKVTMPTKKAAWENDLSHLKGIEDEVFKLFSPADHH